MSEPVRIAMLGSGFVAEFYMQGLANVNGQQVVLNYSRTPKAREGVREDAGRFPNRRPICERVIARDDIDLYIIALPESRSTCRSRWRYRKRSGTRSAPSRWREIETKPNRCSPRRAKSGAMHGYAETEVFAPGRGESPRNDRSRRTRARDLGAFARIA